MRRTSALLLMSCLGMVPLSAHHSFTVHFVPDERITIEGVVTEFRFRNPHGLIFLNVGDPDGAEQPWRVETNSPNILRRRGWAPDSIKPGDHVTIEGYPARDSARLMRVYRLQFEDGREMIGQRPSVPQDED